MSVTISTLAETDLTSLLIKSSERVDNTSQGNLLIADEAFSKVALLGGGILHQKRFVL